MAALDGTDPGNPIALEVARLIESYTENFRAHVERLGYCPESILRVNPQTAIETVAMRLPTETIRDTIAEPRSLTRDGRDRRI
jgi:hypothetical protein